MKRKPKEPRNKHAIVAQFRNSAGAMGKKGRKNTKKYARLRDLLEEAMEVFKEINEEE